LKQLLRIMLILLFTKATDPLQSVIWIHFDIAICFNPTINTNPYMPKEQLITLCTKTDKSRVQLITAASLYQLPTVNMMDKLQQLFFM